MSRDNRNEPEGPRSEIDFPRADTEDKKLARLKRKLALRLDELEDQAEHQFIKQRLLGQIDALEWVIEQIHALRDKDELAQPPVPLVPTHIQEILDSLARAGEDYHVSNSGKKIYIRRNGQWVAAEVRSYRR